MQSLEQVIGSRIRRHRRAQDLTVAELAGTAGISAGMLSRIETGQITPSLGTLQDLSQSLSVPLAHLFAPVEDAKQCSFVQAGQGAKLKRRGTKAGHSYQILGNTNDDDIGFEPFLVTLDDDAEPYTDFQHVGIELLYMIKGEVVYLHGEHKYHLRPGDSLLFDSDARHGPESILERPAVYLSVIVYPRSAR